MEASNIMLSERSQPQRPYILQLHSSTSVIDEPIPKKVDSWLLRAGGER
jgi:hypothetical protein